jgi:hypothetical protein
LSKTSEPRTVRRAVDSHAVPRALAALGRVTAQRVRGAHAGGTQATPRAPWASQRPSVWAVQLGLGPGGHYGIGLQCSPIEQCTLAIFLRVIQIEFISNPVYVELVQIQFKVGT